MALCYNAINVPSFMASPHDAGKEPDLKSVKPNEKFSLISFDLDHICDKSTGHTWPERIAFCSIFSPMGLFLAQGFMFCVFCFPLKEKQLSPLWVD